MSILAPELTSIANLEVILCTDQAMAEALGNELVEMDCKVYIAQSPEDAVSKLQFHSFDIVVLEESYSLDIIQLMTYIPMNIRRHMFFTLVGENVETGNMMQSYVLSANLVINTNDLEAFTDIITHFVKENNFLYRPMHYALDKFNQKS